MGPPSRAHKRPGVRHALRWNVGQQGVCMPRNRKLLTGVLFHQNCTGGEQIAQPNPAPWADQVQRKINLATWEAEELGLCVMTNLFDEILTEEGKACSVRDRTGAASGACPKKNLATKRRLTLHSCPRLAFTA